jgi:hypothetical protein
MDHATRERLDGWIADVCLGDGLGDFPSAVQEHGASVLATWLGSACDQGGVDPEDLTLELLRRALVEHVARLDLPADVHARVPDLCGFALGELERGGRLEDGEDMGRQLRAARSAYDDAAAGKAPDLSRPGAKIGRNDPCPCGSGKKYKRCCG